MTDQQAIYIKAPMEACDGWADMKTRHPRFVKAIEALPDESLIVCVLHELKEVFAEAKKEAERLYP